MSVKTNQQKRLVFVENVAQKPNVIFVQHEKVPIMYVIAGIAGQCAHRLAMAWLLSSPKPAGLLTVLLLCLTELGSYLQKRANRAESNP